MQPIRQDYLKTGYLALKNNDFQEAVNIFRRALEIQKTVSGFSGLGQAFRGLGDLAAARWAFHKGLEIDASNKGIYELLETLPVAVTANHKLSKPRQFRAAKEFLEVKEDSKWRRLFIKGVNLGLGIPGYFPGEYPIREATYLKWFKDINELGANAIRIYTIHPPDFYSALARFNNTVGPLYLFHGIWTELPERNDFKDPAFQKSVLKSIHQAIDVVHGSADLPESPGMAHGRYRSDVSGCTAGFIFGREWEPCAVKAFNETGRNILTAFKGQCLSAERCTPFERWIAETCDQLQSYEQQQYGLARPVSVPNWPTLDPLSHPSESDIEEELLFQGIRVRPGICNENEDMQTLDVTKISSHQGGGFFATYHVYPYYPDFMNNDFAGAAKPYLAYLQQLKKHHGSQPVMIAEFGVPSSREITHWQQKGWHHGGHNDKQLGEVTGQQMKEIHQAGMAGGMMFSWFDEWFKRNWLFLPYELPAERNPFWFNLQDAEQNFGLLAAYPGYPDKLISLNGNASEWQSAAVLYQKQSQQMLHRFNDGHDSSRTLTRLQANSDEGFLYLRLETEGAVDFKNAAYLIGIDTCSPEVGETLLPFNTRFSSPVGLKFVIHLAGKESSRMLVCKSYDKYLNSETELIRPLPADQGEWVTMNNRTNARRISKDNKRFYPARVAGMSQLKFGSLNSSNPAFDSLADFNVNGNAIEVRIPWGLINITDPSSRTVLWQDAAGKTRKTDGIRFVAVSYKPAPGALYALKAGRQHNCTDCLPHPMTADKITTYSWETWNVPVFHTYRKDGYYVYRDILKSLREDG